MIPFEKKYAMKPRRMQMQRKVFGYVRTTSKIKNKEEQIKVKIGRASCRERV